MAFSRSDTLEHFLVATQRYRMDEVTTVPQQNREPDIPGDSDINDTVLDCRNNGKFSVFPQHQQNVLEDETVGGPVSRPLVDCGCPFLDV